MLTANGPFVKIASFISVALAPECDVTMSADSHITVCTSDLYERLKEFYDSGALIGGNIEHNTGDHWLTSPLKYE